MTLNGAYDWGGDVNNHGRRAYAYSPVKPAFLLEEPYDEEGPDGNNVNASATQPVRRFQWWGWLSTIGGYISGNGYVWPFNAPAWRAHLDTQGSRDMARLNAFIQSIAWYELVPSGLGGMKTLITAGGSSVSLSDYVAAAATPDGTLLVAYIPPAHNGPNHRGYGGDGWLGAGALVRSDERHVHANRDWADQCRPTLLHNAGHQQRRGQRLGAVTRLLAAPAEHRSNGEGVPLRLFRAAVS